MNNKEAASDSPFLFISGRLCLDFVNTEMMKEGQRADLTPDWNTLSAWLTEVGLVSRDAGCTEAAVRSALLLRASLRAMAQAMSEGNMVPQAALDTINAVLAQNPQVRQVARNERIGLYQEQFVNEESGFAALLAPIAQDAVDLLCNGEHAFVHLCENPQCILFFYDTTKNHKRRWCRMSACGNRAKAATHYQRHRQQK